MFRRNKNLYEPLVDKVLDDLFDHPAPLEPGALAGAESVELLHAIELVEAGLANARPRDRSRDLATPPDVEVRALVIQLALPSLPFGDTGLLTQIGRDWCNRPIAERIVWGLVAAKLISRHQAEAS